MVPPAADLKSSGRTVCLLQQQWGFVCSYSARGAISKHKAFCGNTTANLTYSPQATKWRTYWILSALIFRIHLLWEIRSGNCSLRHLVQEPHQSGFHMGSLWPP